MSSRSFGPTVLAGLAAAGLTAAASNQSWATAQAEDGAYSALLLTFDERAQAPLPLALSLVVLACWGVVLVTRGVVRRAVAGLGLAAALGSLAAVVASRWTVADGIREDLREIGVPASVDFGVWYVVGLVAAALTVVAAALAVRLVPGWPEMGTRYDAPGEADATASDEEPTNIDLWKAIDEGRDPTQ
ncbi:MAG: Trp biosynthesis-associated membrane protein [Nocardioides sp.]